MRVLAGIVVVTAISSSGSMGLADSNQVTASRIGVVSLSISANDLKPPECASIELEDVTTGSGNFNGTAAADLILGSASNDRINGRQGDDCIVAGAGDDRIIGGGGASDVCIGGTGTNSFAQCEVTD